MSFTHDEYVRAILELEPVFLPHFTAMQYTDAILRLEAEFVPIPIPMRASL